MISLEMWLLDRSVMGFGSLFQVSYSRESANENFSCLGLGAITVRLGQVSGPSAGTDLAKSTCPQYTPLLRFSDNVAHSCAKNGLHIYVQWYSLVSCKIV